MADQPRTQKQIAQKYKDNLDYYRHGDFLRRLKLICFVLAVLGSIGAVFGFRYWSKPEYFSTGPISQNHARFANDCAQCHDGGETDISRALKLDQAITDLKEGNLPSVDLEKLKTAGKNFSPAEMAAAAQRQFSPEKFSALQKSVIKKSSLAGMDRACLKCHEPFKLHQPQNEALRLAGVHPELPLVHSDRCSTCHREHTGTGLMKLPGGETCASCHADLKELSRTRNVIRVASPSPPVKPENRNLGDGLIRFIMPQEANAQPAVITSYAKGHPAFRYEAADARDPAVLFFNHQRHEQADIPKIDGQKLDCSSCHKLGTGDVFYEPVKYQKHCQQCHSLTVVPELPGFAIPHGNPGEVRTFVETMNRQMFTYLLNKDPSVPEADIVARVIEIVKKMRNGGETTVQGFELDIFGKNNAARTGRLSPKANTGQVFPPCAKCHEVTESTGAALRKVTKTNIADRWIQHGPFTHLPHRHMSCIDCHATAHASTDTADILLPPQKLCAECHSPLRKEKLLSVAAGGIAPKPGSREEAANQRLVGGVKWDCQQCHKFHAPEKAIRIIETAKAK